MIKNNFKTNYEMTYKYLNRNKSPKIEKTTKDIEYTYPLTFYQKLEKKIRRAKSKSSKLNKKGYIPTKINLIQNQKNCKIDNSKKKIVIEEKEKRNYYKRIFQRENFLKINESKKIKSSLNNFYREKRNLTADHKYVGKKEKKKLFIKEDRRFNVKDINKKKNKSKKNKSKKSFLKYPKKQNIENQNTKIYFKYGNRMNSSFLQRSKSEKIIRFNNPKLRRENNRKMKREKIYQFKQLLKNEAYVPFYNKHFIRKNKKKEKNLEVTNILGNNQNERTVKKKIGRNK